MMKHLVWLFVLGACTDFETIGRGVCGNGLLEVGEDCDSSDERCISCSVTCDTAADCPDAAYACGVDGLCHAAGGALGVPTTAGTFAADEVRITDIDRDGIGDAFGIARTSVVVRYGDPAGELDNGVSFVTPTQTGPASFGDLDRDGALDVTLTTFDGLVSYASEFGELAPLPVNGVFVSSENGSPLDVRKLFYIGRNVFAGVFVDAAANAVAVVTIDAKNETTPISGFAPCFQRLGVLPASALPTGKIDVFNVSGRADDVLDAVVAITVGTGANRKFCVVSIHRDAPALFGPVPPLTFADITPIAAPTPTTMPVLADIDADFDPCPGFVVVDNGLAAPVYWDGNRQTQNGPCVMAPPSAGQNPKTLPAIPARPGATLIGRAPVTPSVFLIAADALVTSDGIYPTLLGTYFFPVYQTTREVTHFAHGDFDGDEAVDIVLGSSGEEDLDMLFRVRVGDDVGFNFYRLDTATGVSTLTSGDFDGNSIDDVVYSEQLEEYERLFVSYGTRDRPLAPERVGTFREIISVDRVSFADSVDTLATAEDLVVFQPPVPGQALRRVSVFHGSPQRTLMPYFDPRSDARQADTLFRGSIIGNFASGSGAGEYTDLVAIAPVIDGDGVYAWAVHGTPDGLNATQTGGVVMQGAGDCSSASSAMFCLESARYLPFATAPDRDVVIGIDRGRHAVMVDPWASNVTTTPLAELAAVLPAQTVPKSLYAADLDGDGGNEIVVAMAPQGAGSGAGAIITCAMDGGTPRDCVDHVPAIRDVAMTAGVTVNACYDATVARLSQGSASADVIVACRGEGTLLFRIHGTSDGRVVERVATVPAPVTALRGGDVTGDGVDDLILLGGETVSTLIVYPQCTSRDLACIGGGK